MGWWSRQPASRRLVRSRATAGRISGATVTARPSTLDALGDDLATIRATGQVFNALDGAILDIGEPRLRGIARLRAQGWSYNRLVEETGLSKTRVAQLVSEARARGIR